MSLVRRGLFGPTAAVLLGVLLAVSGFGQVAIVNSASYESDATIAPGSIASAFGSNLCAQPMHGTFDSAGNLPTSLGGCSVMVGGTAAMLYYVSPGQVNFVVPAAGPGKVGVRVNNGTFLHAGEMTVARAAPGLFSMNGLGVGEGAIVHGTMWRRGPFSVTTNGAPTPLSIFLTGVDLSTKPAVLVGGVETEILYYGPAPGWPGLEQINISLPSSLAGAGQVPVVVISDGVASNVTTIHLLPTDAMMQGMPGWGQGMHIEENGRRDHEEGSLAFNTSNNTVLVSDEEDQSVRVISLASQSTVATISMPDDSDPAAIAVNGLGTLAGVALPGANSVAILDLAQNKLVSVIGVGYFPMSVAFAGNMLLVANHAVDSVSVIDLNTMAVVRTVTVGLRPRGIAVDMVHNRALVANMLTDSLSVINLTDYTVTMLPLPAGTRPFDVAVSPVANKAVVSSMMFDGVVLVNLADGTSTEIHTGAPASMGPAGVVVSGSTAYVANQMTGKVSAVDLVSGKVTQEFKVDPGPRAVALDTAANRLIVLCQGTGTVDVVDLASGTLVARLSGILGDRGEHWQMPLITAITPSSAKAGTTFTLTIDGLNLNGVTRIEFARLGGMMDGGMGGSMGGGMGSSDDSIAVTNIKVASDGTRLTATVQISAGAAAGTRMIRLETEHGDFMEMMGQAPVFAVLAP